MHLEIKRLVFGDVRNDRVRERLIPEQLVEVGVGILAGLGLTIPQFLAEIVNTLANFLKTRQHFFQRGRIGRRLRQLRRVAPLGDGGGNGVDLIGDLTLHLRHPLLAKRPIDGPVCLLILEPVDGSAGEPRIVAVHGAVIYRQVIRGLVEGQWNSVAIENGAARGFNFCRMVQREPHLLLPKLRLRDLQMTQAKGQGAEGRDEEDKEDGESSIEHVPGSPLGIKRRIYYRSCGRFQDSKSTKGVHASACLKNNAIFP